MPEYQEGKAPEDWKPSGDEKIITDVTDRDMDARADAAARLHVNPDGSTMGIDTWNKMTPEEKRQHNEQFKN